MMNLWYKAKEKRDRKTIVRTSDSNDGLMAGFTRKKDSAVVNVRKRTKPGKKPAEETKPVAKVDTGKLTNAPQEPVGDILSIKKVTKDLRI